MKIKEKRILHGIYILTTGLCAGRDESSFFTDVRYVFNKLFYWLLLPPNLDINYLGTSYNPHWQISFIFISDAVHSSKKSRKMENRSLQREGTEYKQSYKRWTLFPRGWKNSNLIQRIIFNVFLKCDKRLYILPWLKCYTFFINLIFSSFRKNFDWIRISIKYFESGENKDQLQNPKNDIESYIFTKKHLFNAYNNNELNK